MLAWVARGAHEWFQRGQTLPTPSAAISLATQHWREEGDPLFTFLSRHLSTALRGFVELSHLHEAFNDQLPRGQQPWGQTTFLRRVKEHPTMRERGGVWGNHPRNRRSGFRGVVLRDE